MNTLNLHFNTSPAAPISLTTAAAAQFIDGIIPAHLIISITAAPDVQLHVADDLAGTGALIKHEIFLIAHERAFITYRQKVNSARAAHPEPVEGRERVSYSSTAIIEKHITARLLGEHATINVHSACLATGTQVFKFNTLQDHIAANTTSNLMIKVICDDYARLNSNNMIRIHKGAQRSNAEQANKNILLSKTARAVSIPQLEIEANDVRCKHGAAVSTLDQEQLFYLQSRGIEASQTRAMLVAAFLEA